MAGLDNPSGASSTRPRSFLRRRLPAVFATSLVFLLTLGGISAALGKLTYNHVDGQIRREPPGLLQPKDPAIKQAAKQTHAENYLIIGTDDRSTVEGQRSDTTMLVHLSPDHKKAIVVSIPRDSYVTIPACTDSKGVRHPEHKALFNSAITVGGAACTIKTVQALTGISIKHFVQINFPGFKAVINALGSVTICSPTAVTITKGVHLTLKAGDNKLDGAEALDYVRARHGLGDGSDLGRITRQQRFLSAVLREARGGALLTNPGKLNSFVNAATKAVTVDDKTHIGDLKTLFDALRGLDPKHVTLYTAPIANRAYNPKNPSDTRGANVLLDDKKGRILYDEIINDAKIAPSAKATSATPTLSAGPTTLTVAPSTIKVAVTNGTDAAGLAGKVQTALSGLGFQKGVLAKEPQNATGTIVKYTAAQTTAARTVAAAFPNASMQVEAAHSGAIEVVVGTKYDGVRAVTAGQTAPAWVQSTVTTPSAATPTPTITGGISAADKTCTNTH